MGSSVITSRIANVLLRNLLMRETFHDFCDAQQKTPGSFAARLIVLLFETEEPSPFFFCSKAQRSLISALRQ
jgi:hypothetical protein